MMAPLEGIHGSWQIGMLLDMLLLYNGLLLMAQITLIVVVIKEATHPVGYLVGVHSHTLPYPSSLEQGSLYTEIFTSLRLGNYCQKTN